MRKRIVLWCLIILNLAGIFFFSHQSSTVSTSWSNRISRQAEIRISDYETKTQAEKNILHANMHSLIRDTAHALLFFLLGVFVFWLLSTYRLRWYLVCGGILFGILSSFGDELHQVFVPGRTFEWCDIAHDIQGYLAGMLLVFLILWNRYVIKKRKK